MLWIYNDGGRAAAGFAGKSKDCVCRAIAIATGKPYAEVHAELNEIGLSDRITRGRKKKGRSTADSGVWKPTIRRYLERLGWTWYPTMFVGQGCTHHLRRNELPEGRLIVSVTRHMVAVIDGVMHDTHDCSRNGNRCVYGYFSKTETANVAS